MNYLSVENISKSYGERVLFDAISFGINKDQKIAFVAKNGTGKTSILNIITGNDSSDTGQFLERVYGLLIYLRPMNSTESKLLKKLFLAQITPF